MRPKDMNMIWAWIYSFYRERGKGEQGIALISVILLIMVLSFVSAATIVTTTTELKIGGNFKTSVQAFYIAEAGLQHSKNELISKFTTHGMSASQVLAANKNTSTSLMLDSSDIAAIKTAPANASFPKLVYNGSFSGGSYSVYVTNDPPEGATSITDTNKILTLTSVGYAPNGTVAVVQALCLVNITTAPPPVSSMLGAVSMLGDKTNFNFGNSNAESINGDATTSGIAASTLSGLTGITNPKNVNGNGASTAQVRAPSAPFDTPQHLHDYYTQLKGVANAVGNFYNTSNPVIPSLANPNNTPIVVNGDLTLTTSGSGILVVTGTLTINNNVNWNGLILVLGKGNLQRGNNGDINGAVAVGSIVGNIDTGTGITGAWGTSTLGGTNGGGNGKWQYDPSRWSGISQASPSGATITQKVWKQF